MKSLVLVYLGFVFSLVVASVGDGLPEFQNCLYKCSLLMNCEEDVSSVNNYISDETEYTKEFFEISFPLNPLFHVFWSCKSDCNYKCQQIITALRLKSGSNMEQFYGKWPFFRVFGIQEFYSSIFSLGNLYINYLNLFIVMVQYNKNKKLQNKKYANITKQYLWAILGSLVGWTFSTIYHVRDTPLTESLDYFGAFFIVLLNFNAISYRFLKIYNCSDSIQNLWKLALLLTYICHFIKLSIHWDYKYNIIVNSTFGMAGTIMWFIHSYNICKLYNRNKLSYKNSIQLLPFETKILSKLRFINSSWIPLIPVFLNAWLLFGVSFEFYDFAPINQLIDGHALWHLATILPSIVWYDWNVWDIELLKVTDDLQNLKMKSFNH